MDVDDFLEHHGIRGMKWGQHRFGRVQSGAGYATGKTHPAGSGKPPWQRAPAVKAVTPQLKKANGALNKLDKVGRGKQKTAPSADALEIHALRQKVKKHGAASLTNDDLSKIAKRAELQQKYNKAYPKKKSYKKIAAEIAISNALTAAGEMKITGFVGARNPDAAVTIARAMTAARVARAASALKN